MRPARLLGPIVFLAGVAALAVGVLQGQATLSLFVIFPVVTATGGWSVLGIVLMVAGFFLFFVTWASPMDAEPAMPPATSQAAQPPEPAASRRWGGVVFLGPIPVVFGSDQKIARWMLILGAVLVVALVVVTILSLRAI